MSRVVETSSGASKTSSTIGECRGLLRFMINSRNWLRRWRYLLFRLAVLSLNSLTSKNVLFTLCPVIRSSFSWPVCSGNVVQVLRCLVTGLFANAARLLPGIGTHYVTVASETPLRLHPSSVLSKLARPPK